jgi:peptidoglycan/LPS O-acetylase OafA/YrhL
MVVIVHVRSFHSLDDVAQANWLYYTSYGWLGVQVFFVLSGLVLYLPYARGKPLELGSYLVARGLRIVPGLWVALALSATVLGMWSWALVRHGLFVNAVANPAIDPIPPTWTLTIEMGFYLLLPVLVWVFVRQPRCRTPLLVLLIAAGILVRQLYVQGTVQGTPLAPLGYVDNFALGVLAATLVVRVGRMPRWMLAAAAASFAAGLAVTAVFVMPYSLGVAVAAALFAVSLGVLAAVNPGTPIALVWLGTISYGIYLWHWPILIVATDNGLYRLPDALEIALVCGVAILAGWASWRLVERPVLRLRRSVGRSASEAIEAHATAPPQRTDSGLPHIASQQPSPSTVGAD